jgi:aspartate-semialdehyde dehydrogenase
LATIRKRRRTGPRLKIVCANNNLTRGLADQTIQIAVASRNA